MIYALDFDGTLCVNTFPKIGKPNKELIKKVIKYKENGNELILWTCRNGKELKEAVEWCKEQGIEFDAVNEDLPRIKSTKFGKNKSVKIYADVYLDDKAEKVEIKESIQDISTPHILDFILQK